MRDDFDTTWPEILAMVPNGRNPFDFVQRNMTLQAHDKLTRSTFSVLILLAVLTILNNLALVFCLLWALFNGREGRSKHLWIFRHVRLKEKRFVIAPNSSLFIIVFQSLSGAATLVYFYLVGKSWNVAPNVLFSSVWFNLTFVLSFIGLWIAGVGYWSASLSRQPEDLRSSDRTFSSISFVLSGAICGVLASALYVFASFMMESCLKGSRESELRLRTQLQTYALAWTKDPRAVNAQDIASFYRQWRDTQDSFALWRVFTGTLQGIMSFLLCMWYFVAASALQRVQHLVNTRRPTTSDKVEKIAKASRPKEESTCKISKIELLILYCYAMVICSLGYSISLLVCYHLPHQLQATLSANGNDAVLKIVPLILISLLSSIQTWNVIVRKRTSSAFDAELFQTHLQQTSDPSEAKAPHTISALNHPSLSIHAAPQPLPSFDYLYPPVPTSQSLDLPNQNFHLHSLN